MDARLEPRLKQDVSSGTPPRGVLSFVKLFFGQAKKSLFHIQIELIRQLGAMSRQSRQGFA